MNQKLKMNFVSAFLVVSGVVLTSSAFATQSFVITSAIYYEGFDREAFLAISTTPPAVLNIGACDDSLSVPAMSIGVDFGQSNGYKWENAKNYQYTSKDCDKTYRSIKTATASSPVTLYFTRW